MRRPHQNCAQINIMEPAIGDIPSPSFWDARLVDLCGVCSWHNAPRAGNRGGFAKASTRSPIGSLWHRIRHRPLFTSSEPLLGQPAFGTQLRLRRSISNPRTA
jgi:hypothetical protein